MEPPYLSTFNLISAQDCQLGHSPYAIYRSSYFESGWARWLWDGFRHLPNQAQKFGGVLCAASRTLRRCAQPIAINFRTMRIFCCAFLRFKFGCRFFFFAGGGANPIYIIIQPIITAAATHQQTFWPARTFHPHSGPDLQWYTRSTLLASIVMPPS